MQVFSLARETSKPLPLNVLLPPGEHLGFYDLAERYAVPKFTDFRNVLEYTTWRAWLEKLGIDEPLYRNASNASSRLKLHVEDHWAKEPAEKRRVVEKLAIWLKVSN